MKRTRPTQVRYVVLIPYSDGVLASEAGVEFELTETVRETHGLIDSTAYIPREGEFVRLRNLNTELAGHVDSVTTCEYGSFQTVEVCLRARSYDALVAWLKARGCATDDLSRERWAVDPKNPPGSW